MIGGNRGLRSRNDRRKQGLQSSDPLASRGGWAHKMDSGNLESIKFLSYQTGTVLLTGGTVPLSTFFSQVRKRQTSIRTTDCARSLLIRRFCWAVFWPALRTRYSTDAFPRIAEYNNGRKGGLQREQRKNGSHRNHQLVCRISDPGGLIYGSRHRALRFSRVASFDRLAVHIQDHPRSHNRSEEIAGE